MDHNPFPHRDLDAHSSHGEDVKRLQAAAERVLRHRNQPHRFLPGHHDGKLGPKTVVACTRAAYLLGVTEATHNAVANGRVTIQVQTIIRRPDLRGDKQRRRGHERMDDWRKAERVHDAQAHHGAAQATAAMELLLAHAAAAHYSMGSDRWEGIAHHLKASRREYPAHSDCSSSFTWAWWQVLGTGDDVLNGADWTAGFTGTLLSHGRRVNKDVEGAAALYGSGYPGKHVVYCLGGGRGISQGSEAAPFLVDLHYRSDLMEFRVYG